MNTRRITLTLGTAAGGLLAAAFVPVAVAFADSYSYGAVGPETVTGINGDPPFFEDVQGQQVFDVTDTTTNTTAGTFTVDQANSTTLTGFGNVEDLITNTTGTGAPGIGSVFDTTTFASGWENVYSDLLSGTGSSATSTITDTFATPLGNIDLTPVFDSFATALNPADFNFFDFLAGLG